MRYKSIELHNYAGIYNGMGLNQIKIDLSSCISNKVIIKGKNGSGKSTLLNAINPNPDSNDNFIPNFEARKILVISENNVDYIIQYIHPVTSSGTRGTTKGYISKCIDGVFIELNPNGNISSCKDILFNEFNLDSSYLSLAKLTSENRGLVELRPAERKKLVNSIIHNLETYNNIFKKLSKKSSIFKSNINSLTAKIDHIGNEVQLNSKLGNIEGRLSTLEEEKEKTTETIGMVRVKINDFINILKSNNYNAIVEEMKQLRSSIISISNSIKNSMERYKISDIDAFYNAIVNEINKLSSEKDLLKNKIPLLTADKESDIIILKNKTAQLESLQSEHNYMELSQAIAECEENIRKCEEIFHAMRMSNINIITKDEFISSMESLNSIKQIAISLSSNYTHNQLLYVISNMDKCSNALSIITSLQQNISLYKDSISKLESRYNYLNIKKELSSDLINRPKDCTIDNCPYIASAYKASLEFSESEYNSIVSELNETRTYLKDAEEELKEWNIYREIHFNLLSIIREIKRNITTINKLPLAPNFVDTFMDRILTDNSYEDIDRLYEYVDCANVFEEYNNLKNQLIIYKNEFKAYESEGKIIEEIINFIENINTKINDTALVIEQYLSRIHEIETKLLELESIKSKIEVINNKIKNELIPSKNRYSELESIKNKLDENTAELPKLESNLATLKSNLNSVNNDINILTKERETIVYSLGMLAEYKAELEMFKSEYTKIEKIKYYSSSSTGIQTIYMQLYMNNILNTANELLSMLFDGEFNLQPFIINEQEFRIPCLGSGLMHDDISSMSTAQKSMISIILSYAILHQSNSSYNIISLDEMDGSLDGSNRSYFMTLLDNLMSILKCEQCFIISHNSELLSEMADVVILKDDPSANYGGNVIWRYN